ncbi:uncharacterized protein A1O5_00705 [Cladophialophora psammophila CBS 110553]|uniref:BTB domain-containing protein n=1 Tax=Cladophialophora psammophila CBS 110553 TaxID=1182543 RepID=W9X6U3_9EURO|nr:uncharacterized protein A1O5_00705 [Cladophialophora psammophila CBS 110553]EXJ76197.1 hypothetical protein A1O5_00705 [Cladophialophora psammophila CBS 110553]
MTPSAKGTGKYANPTIYIIVGKQHQPFYVHYAFLNKTDFFHVHGHPPMPAGATPTPTPTPTPTRPGRALNSPAPSENTVTPERDDIKMEQDIEDEGVGNSEDSPLVSGDGAAMPVYRLQGLLYEPAAFEVIINYLYNERPTTPLHRAQVRTLQKAYILALHYRMPGLQDDLVDCFRHFHASYTVRFADLYWISGRIGEGEAVCGVPLVQYLVDQIAFEIYQGGYDTFAHDNMDFEIFLTNGDRPLRKELFKAIAKVAQEKNPIDPALGLNRWKVEDYPTFQRSESASSNTPDIIDVD